MTAKGEKITRSHKTFTETAAEIVAVAEKNPAVTKISLGTIRHVPGGRRDLKFQPINGGFKAVVRGNGAVQDLYIYTSDPKEIQALLTKSFSK